MIFAVRGGASVNSSQNSRCPMTSSRIGVAASTVADRGPPSIRLILAELAFAPLDEAEVELDPFARTVDSLEALGLRDPVFLVGADEFAAFLSWKEPERVLELARLGVATRPGVDREGLDNVLAQLGHPERVSFFEIEPLRVSSSDIRARAARGEPVDAFVPAAVAAEIARLDLYRLD